MQLKHVVKQSISWAILTFVSAGSLALGSEIAYSADTRPNIVLILSDDQAWNDYGFMEHEQIQTPHLDALAKKGATFRRGYVPTALCRPSLASILTGHYASTHHVTGNDPSPKYAEKGSKLFKQRHAELIAKTDVFDLLPQVLGRQGYLSHQSGKLWEGSYQRCGFTHGMTRGFPKPGGRHGDAGLKIGREGLQPIKDFLDIAEDQNKPFFLWYAPYLPHQPHTPPKRLLEKYRTKVDSLFVAKYYAMCEWFDETCGELIGEIDQRGMTDNTLFIYVCDNGWIQNPKKDKYALGSKQSANEGGIRTPIMYSWPGKIAPQDRPELASSLDIYPTILAAAGAEIPDDLPGQNLLPIVSENQPLDRDYLLGEGFAHDIADLNDPSKSLLYHWAIKGDWKLILRRDGEVNRYKTTHPPTPRAQLFNLAADPNELNDLAEQQPDKVVELEQLINAWTPAAHPVASEVSAANEASNSEQPATHCRFVPERKDDFAWENDRVAFRAYGPALRSGAEDSGIDCWLKRVNYPVIDKWYREATEKDKSYHKDHGEGYDPYHVGSSAGCGGSALWLNDQRVSLETFTEYEILESTPERSIFVLKYERKIDGVTYAEKRTITIELGKQLFDLRCEFTKDGNPAEGLPVCVGVATHDGKAKAVSDRTMGWIACWEKIDNSGVGTAALMEPGQIVDIREVDTEETKDDGHIFLIAKTDSAGAIEYKAGFAWENAGEIKSLEDWKQHLNSVTKQ